jgi:hypothetical protein
MVSINLLLREENKSEFRSPSDISDHDASIIFIEYRQIQETEKQS